MVEGNNYDIIIITQKSLLDVEYAKEIWDVNLGLSERLSGAAHLINILRSGKLLSSLEICCCYTPSFLDCQRNIYVSNS